MSWRSDDPINSRTLQAHDVKREIAPAIVSMVLKWRSVVGAAAEQKILLNRLARFREESRDHVSTRQFVEQEEFEREAFLMGSLTQPKTKTSVVFPPPSAHCAVPAHCGPADAEYSAAAA